MPEAHEYYKALTQGVSFGELGSFKKIVNDYVKNYPNATSQKILEQVRKLWQESKENVKEIDGSIEVNGVYV